MAFDDEFIEIDKLFGTSPVQIQEQEFTDLDELFGTSPIIKREEPVLPQITPEEELEFQTIDAELGTTAVPLGEPQEIIPDIPEPDTQKVAESLFRGEGEPTRELPELAPARVLGVTETTEPEQRGLGEEIPTRAPVPSTPLAATAVGAIKSVPFAQTILKDNLTGSDIEQIEKEHPGSVVAGQIVGSTAQALAGGIGAAKVLAKTAVSKSPLLLNALSRVAPAVTLRGAQSVEEINQGKTEIQDALMNTLVESGGGAAFSMIPEIIMPAGVAQVIAQPLADVIYQASVDKLKGEKDVLSKEWFKRQIPTIAASLGFAIKDVAGGKQFISEQKAIREEISGLVKPKPKVEEPITPKPEEIAPIPEEKPEIEPVKLLKQEKVEPIPPKKEEIEPEFTPEEEAFVKKVRPEVTEPEPIQKKEVPKEPTEEKLPERPKVEEPKKVKPVVEEKPVETKPVGEEKVVEDEGIVKEKDPKTLFSKVETRNKKLKEQKKEPKQPEKNVRDIVVSQGKPEATKNQVLTEANAKDDTEFLNKFEKVYQASKESTTSISKVQKVFEKETGAKVKPEDNINFKIDRVRGSGGTAKQFVSDFLEPVFKNIRKGRKTKQIGRISRDLEEYVIAKRQKWLYENKKGYDDVGYSKKWADDVVEMVEGGKAPDAELIKSSANELWDYGKRLKGIKKDFGVIDEEFEKMLKEPYYVPFYRDVEQKVTPGISGQKFTAMSKGIKRIKGSKSGRNIRNVFQNMITQTNETIVNAARNDVFNSIIKFAGESKELGEVIQKLPPRWKKVGQIEHRTEIDKVLTPELDKLISDLGATQKVKIKTRDRLGEFKTKNKEIMTMFGSTESTKAHEIGHLIDEEIVPLKDMVKKFPVEMEAVADLRYDGGEATQNYINYVRKPEEKVAEFVSMYITDRARLAAIAPNAFRVFESRIQSHEKLKKLVDIFPSRQKEIEKITEDNWIMDNSIPRDEDVVSGFVEGKMQHFRVPHELASSVKNLHPEQIPTLLRILTIPTSILRKGAVSYNIDFFIPNAIRDQIGASFNAKNIPVYDYLMGLKHYIAQDKVFKDYMRQGGAMDSPESGVEQLKQSSKELVFGSKKGEYFDPHYWKNTNLMRKTKDLTGYFVAAPFRAIAKLGEASELATRLGVFERGLKSGDNVREAVHSARQASLDFQRFGTHGRVPNQIIPFVNAALEGVDRTVRSAYKHPVRFAAAAFTYAIAPTVGLTLYNKDDEDYKNISDREKENNYIIMKKDGTGEYWKIPKSHVVKLIANPFQMAWERSIGTSQGDWKDIPNTVWSSSSPVDNVGSIIPTGLKLIIEPIANYDFFWKKVIEPPYVKAVGEPGQRFKKSTSETLKVIGKGLNISPIMMQHEINALFSGLGRHTLTAVDWALGKTDVLPPTELTENRIPILRRFKGKAEEWRSETSQAIREIDKTISRIDKASVKNLMKYNDYSIKQATEVLKQNKEMKIRLLKKKKELLFTQSKSDNLIKEINLQLKKTTKQDINKKLGKAIKDIKKGK